jgi:hypothetical protein
MANLLTIELVFGIVLVTSFTSTGLFALWAATSPRHWLLRSAVVLLVLLPLLLIPAYELWIIFALQICVVLSGVQIQRRLTARRRSQAGSFEPPSSPNRQFRFSLRTLFAITALVAVLTAIVTRMVTNWPQQSVESWTTIVLNGVCSGCAVLLGAWMLAAQRKRITWPAALVICLGLAVVMARFDWLVLSVQAHQNWPPRTQDFYFGIPSEKPLAWLWLAVMPAITAATWLAVSVWLAMIGESTGNERQRRAARQIVVRCIFGSLLVVLATPPTLVVWKLLHVPPVPNIVVPQPNGLDDIMAAGKVFHKGAILTTEPGATEELAAEIAAHAGAYKQLRLGLSREVQAPVWTGNDGQITARKLLLDQLLAVHSAAHGLLREAELAQRQKRFGDAATIAVENMQLGQAVIRGGVLADYGIGLNIEGLGDRSLYQVLPQLDARQCRETTVALVEIDHGRESVDDARQRGRDWCALAASWLVRFSILLGDVVPSSDWHRNVRPRLADREAVTRLLIVELALRAYLLERGELPDRFEQLTPEFLAELPVDPFDPDGHPLLYTRTDDGYVVYSIGSDGTDNGGLPEIRNEGGWVDPDMESDLRLDSRFASDDDTHEEEHASDGNEQ